MRIWIVFCLEESSYIKYVVLYHNIRNKDRSAFAI